MALEKGADEGTDRKDAELAAPDVVENAGDEARSHAATLERGLDLRVEQRDQPGLGVVVREPRERRADVDLEAAPLAVVLDADLVGVASSSRRASSDPACRASPADRAQLTSAPRLFVSRPSSSTASARMFRVSRAGEVLLVHEWRHR